MKISLFVVCAAAFLSSGAVAADEVIVAVDEDTNESTPIELSAAQMDQITAGTLLLPNGNTQHDDFDTPAPGDFHHALTKRAQAAIDATTGHGPSVLGFNEGPWGATAVSPVISCVGFDTTGLPLGTGSGCSP